MQQGIVKQIQFSLRSFHLFIHLQDFYWTPTIYGHTEQRAGDIRLQPTVSTQHGGEKRCHQKTRAQLDKCSDGRTQEIAITPGVCVSGGPGLGDFFKGRKEQKGHKAWSGFFWTSGTQPGIRSERRIFHTREALWSQGGKNEHVRFGRVYAAQWLDTGWGGGGERWDHKGRCKEDIRPWGTLCAVQVVWTSLIGTSCKEVTNTGNVCGQSRSFGCLTETSLLTPVMWSVQQSIVKPDCLG